MKRWGFKGMPATHGVSLTHRKGGSIGSSHVTTLMNIKPFIFKYFYQTLSKVIKGKKMAGHMGFVGATAWKLPVLKVDTIHNCIWVKGAVPGSYNRQVRIMDSWSNKIFQFVPPPFPTFIPEIEPKDPLPRESFPDPTYYGRDAFHVKNSPDRAIIR